MEVFLYALLGYFSFQHLIAPLIVWRSSTFPFAYSFPSVSWKDMVANSGASYLARHNELQDFGFCPSVASSVEGAHASSFFVIYRSKSDGALVTLIRSVNSVGEFVSIDITQPYVAGVHVSLTNSVTPPIYPPWEKKLVYRLPVQMPFSELWMRFCVLRNQSGLTNPTTILEGEELALVEKFSNAELKHLFKIGFVEPECLNGKRRFSLKGAYMASWKLLWPWKWLGTRAAHASAFRLSSS
jgi:hypothetical protein